MTSRGSGTLKRFIERDTGDSNSTGSEKQVPLISFQQQPFSHVLQQIRSRTPRLNIKANGKSRTCPPDDEPPPRSSPQSRPSDRASTKSADSFGSLEGSADGVDIPQITGAHLDETDAIADPELRVRSAIESLQAKIDRAQQEHDQAAQLRDSLLDEFIKMNPGGEINPKTKQKFDARQLELQNTMHLWQRKIAKYQDRIKQIEETGVTDQSRLQEMKSALQSVAHKHVLQLPSFKGSKIFGSNHSLRGDGIVDEGQQSTSLSSSSDIQYEQCLSSETRHLEPTPSFEECLRAELAGVRKEVRLMEDKVEALQQQLSESQQRTKQVESDLKKHTEHTAQMEDDYRQLTADFESSQELLRQTQLALNDVTTASEERDDQLQAQMHSNRLQQSEQCNMLEDSLEKNEARITEVEHRVSTLLPESLQSNLGNTAGSSVMVTIVNSLIVILRLLLSTWLRLSRRDSIFIFTAIGVFFLSLLLSYWWRS